MNFVEGMIYQESGFIKGYLGFETGLVSEVNAGKTPQNGKLLAKGVVLPILTNCHTHIGDAIAHGREFTGDITELVAPPNGLKFRILRESNRNELIQAMRLGAIEMLNTGTGTFIDFREEGVLGVELLTQAIQSLPINPLILGRPKTTKYSKDELDQLLEKVDGIGVSSMLDWEYAELEKVAKVTKRLGKSFALHASERLHEDIDPILDLHPDFLVHMTYGTDYDFEKLSELGIPVVLCLRSNIFFNNIPNIPKMLNKGVTLVLGSDNLMLNTPNLFEELKAGFKLANRFGEVKPETLLNMISLNLKKILNPKYYINLAPGSQSNFIVLDVPLTSPELSLMNGIEKNDIKLIVIGNNIWKYLK